MPFDLQPVLTGTLLALRPLRPDDFDALFAVASDPLIWEQHPQRERYREDVFRTVVDLTHRSYLSFCAAGPQVCITEKGIAYLQKGAGRRHSVREP